MKVYACPDEVPAPETDYKNFNMEVMLRQEAEHQQKLMAWLKDNGFKGKNTGKILRIPHADGSANYMFADGSKCALVLLPYGDAWDSPLASKLTKAEVLKRIASSEALSDILAAT